MTLDEARLILNLKKEDTAERILQVRVQFRQTSLSRTYLTDHLTALHDASSHVQNYEHLFKANSPPAAPAKPTSGRQAQPIHSHYLQSKVVRARERLDAELKAALGEDSATSTAPQAEAPAGSQSGPTPPPPSS